ncbi:hypothetical protein AJ87_22480 [Rhizobium yanglingense]|nr:hypothetical protein AJ87_22480 [Rhizobium yanglingense]
MDLGEQVRIVEVRCDRGLLVGACLDRRQIVKGGGFPGKALVRGRHLRGRRRVLKTSNGFLEGARVVVGRLRWRNAF